MKVKALHLRVLSILSIMAITCNALGQEKKEPEDSSTSKAPSKNSVIKPYKEVITPKAHTTKGLFIVHKIEDRYLFEIPGNMLNKKLLVEGRIAKAPVDADMLTTTNPTDYLKRNAGFNGDQTTENIIEFLKGPKNKVLVQADYFFEKASDSSDLGLWKAIQNNNLQPFVASFDIKAFTPDSTGVVIDVTDFLNSDNQLFFFSPELKKKLNISAITPDRSYTENVKTYPINLVVKTVKTYKAGESFATYELNTSIVMLPEKPIRTRFNDSRVPYAGLRYQDFDINPYGVEEKKIMYRWNLVPADKDMERYRRGELVEPKKPIIIYIDPATPKKWVPYFIQGVNDWQQAFERAGFKNAIMGKEAPQNNPEWGLENVMYSSIVYKPSTRTEDEDDKPFIADPRTGEIIEAHINFYHSSLEEMYKKYFISCSNVDPRVRDMKINDELMGQLIRAYIAHQVGHSLGLAHNLSASNNVPVEKLRNKEWLAANGIAPSIMDVLSYNYVAQPNDQVGMDGLLPKVGAFDKWAIQYGYQLQREFNSLSEETIFYDKWIVDSTKKNPMLVKAGDYRGDPRNQTNVLGDNPMKANEYGISNLKSILPKMAGWTKDPIKGYQKFGYLYKEAFAQYRSYIFKTLPFLGGLQSNFLAPGQPGFVFDFVDKAKQKEALAFVNRELFNTPQWLFNKEYFELTGGYANPSLIFNLQKDYLNIALDNELLYMMGSNYGMNPKNAYKVSEYLADLKKYIFSEIPQKQSIDPIKRVLQKQYINILGDKITPGTTVSIGNGMKKDITISSTSEGALDIKNHLRRILTELKAAAIAYPNRDSKLHLNDLVDKINMVFSDVKSDD